MSRAINIEFIIILITAQCINLNSYSDNKVQKLFPNGNNTNEGAMIDSEKFKQCNLSDFLCRLDHLKQWKRRRRLHASTLKQQFVNDSLFNRGKRGSLAETRNAVQRLRLRAPLESDASLISEFKARWPVARWRRFLFSDDYLLLINEHWLRFAPPDPAANYTLGALYIVMMCAGGCGNALVLFMYFRCRTLRTPGNILVANLALSDFFMLAKTPVFIFNSFNLGPALGKTGCVIYGFVGGLTGVTSIATLAAIALDRYWAVVRPLEPLRALTAVRARLLGAGAWLYAAAFASVPALDVGYGRYVPEGYLTSCSFDYLTEELSPRYFIFTFFCAAWVAPFATITFCYINILRVVVCTGKMTARNQERLSSRHVKEQVKRKAEIKLAVLVIVVIALFFVSWTPYAIVALMGIFGKKDLITPIVSMVPALFCKTAACINPFIYIITHPKFRKEFRKFIFREKSRRMSTYSKTIGYTEADTTKVRRPSREPNSDTDVEIIQMKDIPYDKEETTKPPSNVKTISSRVSEREGSQRSQRSVSMKSFEESVVSPPSWYAKPQFSKKRSFHRRSSRSVVCLNPDPLVL